MGRPLADFKFVMQKLGACTGVKMLFRTVSTFCTLELDALEIVIRVVVRSLRAFRWTYVINRKSPMRVC